MRDGIGAVLVRLALPVVILGVGWFAFTTLRVEPEREKDAPPKPRSIRTQVTELRVEDFTAVIETNGVVRAHNEVTLTPQVPGRVVKVYPGLEDGAFFSEGDVLVELDPVDFETAVVVAEAQVARTEAALLQEQTRADQALLNWRDLGYTEEPNELVLRKPQVREARANFDSANAQLERAQRDLERTKIKAPFDGRVRQRAVGVGQSVGSGTALASVFDVGVAEVRLPLTGRQLEYLELPETADDAAVKVELRNAIDADSETVWEGEIVRTEGALNADTLELFAIAQVEDPFGLVSGDEPLRIGQPVVAGITGKVLEGVVAVPRSAILQLSKIYLVDGEAMTLSSRTLEPIWKNEEFAVVRDETIPDGALLATTRLVYAPEGASVEIIPEIGADAETAGEEKEVAEK